MTTTSLNPFPDYAVTRLAASQGAAQDTIVTVAIAKARDLVETYMQGFATPGTSVQGLKTLGDSTRTNAALCAVRGDYGTGKTYLLNDVAAHLESQCATHVTSITPSILRATCIETDPLSWFRTKIGPHLDTLPLDEVVLHLYSSAGKTVAKATALTESAAEVLDRDPTRIRNLIRDNQISVDEVGREFRGQLGIICKGYDEMVRRVLAHMVSSETDTPARKWLLGGTLTPREAELLSVSPSIESADQATAVVGAIAALHKAAKRPFLVLIDELEHFVRHDIQHKSWGNMTWLKRLLEQLGSAGALALVAGHWSAWETTKDYLDRFPQYAPIDLLKLETKDVLRIVRERVSNVSDKFGEQQAQAIASVTAGNMRRVMSLCNLLFRQSSGFTAELPVRQIHEVWTSLAQRISQEQALEQITNFLVSRGYSVETAQATFRALPFDLVGERGDGHAILVEAKHSVTQRDHYDAARQFIDKLESVASAEPDVTGIFLANGSIDDELLGLLRDSRLPSLRWFDLTERDVMDKIRANIDGLDEGMTKTALASEPAPSRTAEYAQTAASTRVIQSEAEKLRVMNAELERKLRELDDRRNKETLALNERLETLSRQVSSPRVDSVRGETEINPDRARASYEAMLEKPSLTKMLQYLGLPLAMGSTYIAVGIALFVTKDFWLYFWRYSEREVATYSAGATIAAIVSLILGAVIIGRRYVQVVSYFEFSRRVIRDLYLRNVPIDSLSRVDTILRSAIDRRGVYYARGYAVDALKNSKGFPLEVERYVEDLMA